MARNRHSDFPSLLPHYEISYGFSEEHNVCLKYLSAYLEKTDKKLDLSFHPTRDVKRDV